MAGDAAEPVDYATFYRRRCEEQGCRINSAVAARLDAASYRPLVQLDLGNNYVGPKGVRPILDLLKTNPTVEFVDLSRNGLDNEAICLLADIARKHIGITSLNLSYNPFTQDAGKALFALVEDNDRIIDMNLNGTEVYHSLMQRIHLSVNHNRELHHLQPRLRETGSRPAPTKMGGAATRRPQQPARCWTSSR